MTGESGIKSSSTQKVSGTAYLRTKGRNDKFKIRDDIKPVTKCKGKYHTALVKPTKLEQDGIIEKVKDQLIPSISSIINNLEKMTRLSLCVVMKQANHAMESKRQVMSMLKDFRAKINESKFSPRLTSVNYNIRLNLHQKVGS